MTAIPTQGRSIMGIDYGVGVAVVAGVGVRLGFVGCDEMKKEGAIQAAIKAREITTAYIRMVHLNHLRKRFWASSTSSPIMVSTYTSDMRSSYRALRILKSFFAAWNRSH
jgi:hypothetical protein